MARDDRFVLGWSAFAVAVAAVCLALFGLGDSGDAAGGDGAAAEAATATTVIDVDLSDFALDPSMPEVPAGRVEIRLTNSGSSVHNLSIPQLGLRSADVQPGASDTLDLGEVAAGDYDMLCEIPGHADAGMKGMLMVGAAGHGGDGEGGGGAAAPPTTMGWQEMDRMMDEVAHAFPAETEGHGGELLAPTVLPDGTKQFDLTASIVDWEVAPGKVVEAWTYNGVVPAPELHVEVGDRVRINLRNELPESTSLHLHGIRVPNSMDGVDPYTQPAIQPGGSFTYEFEALEPAVGIYHSHHDAQVQVPNGLFGALTIGEMPIPRWLQDRGVTTVDHRVNMVLNDAGTIGLSLNGKSFPATEPYTMRVGETMVVNYLNEGLMAHPMHLHQPMGWVIAKDGIPLEVPMPGDTINVAPGERYTVLYEAKDPGVWAWHCHILTHAEGPTGMFGMVTALIVEE